MANQLLTGLTQRRLQRGIVMFFLALAIPTAILIQQAYSQLKWQSFHQHHLMAKDVAARIDVQFSQLIDLEQQRSFSDYSFLTLVGDSAANFLQRSPLSGFPIKSPIPGVIGYFQVDSAGNLVTPLLPDQLAQVSRYGVNEADLNGRVALQSKLHEILSQNSLVRSNKARTNIQQTPQVATDDDPVTQHELMLDDTAEVYNATELTKPDKTLPYLGQKGFDQLNSSAAQPSKMTSKLGRVEDLKLNQAYLADKEQLSSSNITQADNHQRRAKSSKRVEEVTLPKQVEQALEKFENQLKQRFPAAAAKAKQDASPILTFESEIDPFEFSQLASGHFVLFRTVWLNSQRYIQGLLIEQDSFLDGVVKQTFGDSPLANMSQLLVVHQGDVLVAFNHQQAQASPQTTDLAGELLYQSRLSAPLNNIQLLFSITHLPSGPASNIINWLAATVSLVLLFGFYFLYRLGMAQIKLANQQRDFVSAVSHELKTPLTSIRMYGEILKQGWATEQKKTTYYDFIFDESERLTRLINNLLLMAKLSRNIQQPELKVMSINDLMQQIMPKVASQIEREGFAFSIDYGDIADSQVLLDPDWFAQIMINLVDNAIKFSQHSNQKKIEVNCIQDTNGMISFNVRDFGPGIAKDQMKEIFKLFYRSEDELTRETVGTGIGLALVHHMVLEMNGKIVVSNSKPGAVFTLRFVGQT